MYRNYLVHCIYIHIIYTLYIYIIYTNIYTLYTRIHEYVSKYISIYEGIKIKRTYTVSHFQFKIFKGNLSPADRTSRLQMGFQRMSELRAAPDGRPYSNTSDLRPEVSNVRNGTAAFPYTSNTNITRI